MSFYLIVRESRTLVGKRFLYLRPEPGVMGSRVGGEAGGLPADKIVVKPNFCEAESSKLQAESRNGALFVGRLSAEKGVATLLTAWQGLEVPLTVVGDGPLRGMTEQRKTAGVTLLGRLDHDEVAVAMERAAFLVMPSEWYETFGMVTVEAFAHGLPVIASRLGAMAEIVGDGITGLLFEPGNADDLAAKARWLHTHPEECRRMGDNARQVYEEYYTPERNYEMLMEIYENVRRDG